MTGTSDRARLDDDRPHGHPARSSPSAPRRREGGLGKRLADILTLDWAEGMPVAATSLAPPRPEAVSPGVTPSARQQTLAAASLELVRDVIGLDLCVYLHRPPGEGYRVLAVGRPEAAPPPPPFALLDIMRSPATPGKPSRVCTHGYECVLSAATGLRSPYVLLVGRYRAPVGRAEAEQAEYLFRLVALSGFDDSFG